MQVARAMRTHKSIGAVAGVLAGLACAGAVAAQPAPPPAPAANIAAAPAGHYVLDSRHVGVIARVPHGGFSYSIFRFDTVSGQLDIDPAAPANDKLSVTVDPASIATNVPGFPAELTGPRFLDVAKFPQATFVSTAFRQIDASHGQVDGVLTLMGVAKPVTFDATLIGAGKGMMGATVIGVSAKTEINVKDYPLPPFFAGKIQLLIDVEFDKH